MTDAYAQTGTRAAARIPATNLVYAVLVVGAVVVGCLVFFGAVLGVAHASVSAKVDVIAEHVTQDVIDKRAIKERIADDHERIVRIEAQLEYLVKLTLIAINDQRAAAGRPLVPDEMPRAEGK